MSDYVLPANAPLPGEMFAERYRIDRILGVGGMGFVVAATHVHLHEKVAIKMLLPELASNKQTVERFLREGRAAVKIRSEHVARVLDVGELAVDRTPYLVMEYLDGCDLALYLESEGKVEPAKAVAWVLQACEAIAEAHAMKTVHRDLKPANLFLAEQPNGSAVIKVLDFGISKMTGIEKANLSMTKTSAMLGSPLYMSPEQLRSARNVDERSDIWSIGVILYELIIGHPPFVAETLAELGALVLTGETPRVTDIDPTVSSALCDVIATCMQKKAEDRFVNLADFAATIAPFGAEGAEESLQTILKTLGGVPSTRAPISSSTAPIASRSGSNPSHAPLVRTQRMAGADPTDARSDPHLVSADTVDLNVASGGGGRGDAPIPSRTPNERERSVTPFPGYGVTASGVSITKKTKRGGVGVVAGVFALFAILAGTGVLLYKQQVHVAPASASTITAETASASAAPPLPPSPQPSQAAAEPTPTAAGSSVAPPVAKASTPPVISVSRQMTPPTHSTTGRGLLPPPPVSAAIPTPTTSVVIAPAPAPTPSFRPSPAQIATGSKD